MARALLFNILCLLSERKHRGLPISSQSACTLVFVGCMPTIRCYDNCFISKAFRLKGVLYNFGFVREQMYSAKRMSYLCQITKENTATSTRGGSRWHCMHYIWCLEGCLQKKKKGRKSGLLRYMLNFDQILYYRQNLCGWGMYSVTTSHHLRQGMAKIWYSCVLDLSSTYNPLVDRKEPLVQ